MAESCDVFVVGGGPAGLAAGICARMYGFRVIVADAGMPPIDKPCAEGLLPDAVTALARIGIPSSELAGYRVESVRFFNGQATAEGRFPMRHGIGVRRTKLHETMVKLADERGVNLLWKTRVTEIGRYGLRAGDRQIHASWIIGADGAASKVRRWAGLDRGMKAIARVGFRRHYRVRPWSRSLEIYWGREAQCYVTPIGENEVCAAVVSDEPEMRLERALQRFPALMTHLAGAEAASTERGSLTATRRLHRVWNGRVALIGDASGGVDAITGEGLSLAFHQAPALAEAMAAGDLSLYQRNHRRILRRPAMMVRLMLLLGRHPDIQKRITQVFGSHPSLFERFIAAHVGVSSNPSLAASTLMLGWRMLTA